MARRHEAGGGLPHHGVWWVWPAVALTGVYGGYFGAAQGVLLMAVGPFLHGRNSEVFLIIVAGAAALVSVVYSYAIYRRPNEKEVSS